MTGVGTSLSRRLPPELVTDPCTVRVMTQDMDRLDGKPTLATRIDKPSHVPGEFSGTSYSKLCASRALNLSEVREWLEVSASRMGYISLSQVRQCTSVEKGRLVDLMREIAADRDRYTLVKTGTGYKLTTCRGTGR